MNLRIATFNLEQNRKNWQRRRELIVEQLADLNPDILALNEIHIPEQTGRWLQSVARDRLEKNYCLLQQSKAGDESRQQAEGLLSRYPPRETVNLDYGSHNCVALAARFEIGARQLDVYVTHLIAARVDDSARQYQVEQLLKWVGMRTDADCSIVCGDFNAAPDQLSTRLMAGTFQASQFAPTAFTPLRDEQGQPTHPKWPRMDRCIDYVWFKGKVSLTASGVCFATPASDDPDLWPSDHVGVWADLEIF
jgi:endonuclease/exonuclease/phosphatase family metal-dependent hydrolase